MDEFKQVIVIRKDLNMRKGKMVAQGAHASVLAVLSMLNSRKEKRIFEQWSDEGMTKICVSVDSEEELIALYNKVGNHNIPVSLVRDAGRTEFNGEPTFTSIAIGPWYTEEIDNFTSDLKLL